jgi:hypothetical protein
MVEHQLSDEAVRRLKAFLHGANKGVSLTHPLDIERWHAFLIRAHQEGSQLGPDTLGHWLVEKEDWPEDRASALVLEYGFARTLLSHYDTALEELHGPLP